MSDGVEGESNQDRFHLTATVYDEKKGQEFKIKATGDEIRVYPLSEDFGLGTFARFVEFIQKHVDHEAEVVTRVD